MTFKTGDKFILELGEERKMFKEFQIAGTDLYVKKDLLEKLTPYKPGNLNIEHKSDDEQDLISRQCAIDAIANYIHNIDKAIRMGRLSPDDCKLAATSVLEDLPSAHPEQLTDNEQRIFLAAMWHEEMICKQVEDKYKDCRDPNEDSLVRICHEITRKVKGALWT